MRGYLTPNRLDLTVRQNRQYFYGQCGLCQQLKEDHGSLARFLVNRDALLLQLLVEALQEQVPVTRQIRCAVNPFLHLAKASPIAAKFASAVTILMFSGKLHDTVLDGNFVYSIGSKLSLLINKTKINRAKQQMAELGLDPRQIFKLLEKQQHVEKLHNVNIEKAASQTASGLGLLFGHIAVLVKQPNISESLQQLGYHVGKFIYVLDARDDLKSDLESSQFNPLKTWHEKNKSVGLTTEQANEWLENELIKIKNIFHTLGKHFNFHQEILHNLFCLGLN